MAMKEIWVYLLAYNLVPGLMLRAALHADVEPRQLSFKHTRQFWLAWRNTHRAPERQEILPLVLVARRPGRIEPRAVKRRPKPYRLLTQPPPSAREGVRTHGHPVRVKLVPFVSVPLSNSMMTEKENGAMPFACSVRRILGVPAAHP